MKARCAICKSERAYDAVGPGTRCGECGARGGVRVTSVAVRVYVPSRVVNRPSLPALARALDNALAGRANAAGGA